MIRIMAVFVLLLVLVGCGGTSSRGPAAEIDGPWSGTWRSSRGGGGTTQVTFNQDGTTIGGSVRITGSPCLSTGTLSGTITSSNVSFGAVSGPHGMRFTATVGATTMTGS